MGEPSVRLVAVAPSIIDLRPPPGLDSSSQAQIECRRASIWLSRPQIEGAQSSPELPRGTVAAASSSSQIRPSRLSSTPPVCRSRPCPSPSAARGPHLCRPSFLRSAPPVVAAVRRPSRPFPAAPSARRLSAGRARLLRVAAAPSARRLRPPLLTPPLLCVRPCSAARRGGCSAMLAQERGCSALLVRWRLKSLRLLLKLLLLKCYS